MTATAGWDTYRPAITAHHHIGDQIRLPAAWCQTPGCIQRHTDPAALGEADIRNRAITAGWRADAFGRLTCPRCQQNLYFHTTTPPVPWDWQTAMYRMAVWAHHTRRGTA
jgi:hypothetical protein